MAGNAFRCTVTRDGKTVTSELYADDPEVISDVPQVNLLWYDDSPHVDPDGKETAEGYTMGKTDYIEYFHSDTWRGDGFDVHGVDKNVTPNLSFQTTYQDAGFLTYAAAENADPIEEIRIPYMGNVSTNGDYKDIWTPFGQSLSAQVELQLSPEAFGGRYVKVVYRVKNDGSTPQNFRIGSHGDVMIHDNDCAKIWREGKTLVMDGQTRNIYRFNLVAPTCFSTWFGYYRRARENMFKQLLIDDGVAIYDDSGMAWSWKYETIEPGDVWERYVLVGAGDLPPAPQKLQVTTASGSRVPGEKFTVNISCADADPKSTVYVSFAGEETNATLNSGYETELTMPTGQKDGTVPLSVWVVTPTGGLSTVQTVEIPVYTPPVMKLTQSNLTLIEDEVGTVPADWNSFVDPTSVGYSKDSYTITPSFDIQTPGEYKVTYTATVKKGEENVTATNALTVTVKAKPAKLEQAVVTGDSGKGPFTLEAKLTYPGPATITETGFVYGPAQNPTVGMAGCKTKATASPMVTKGQNMSVTLEKDTDLVPGLFYYARPYVKFADGKYIYGAQCSENFYVEAEGFGNFTVVTTSTPGQFKVIWNGTVGTHTIHYRTVNGSAVGGTHFTHKNGVLTFTPQKKEHLVDVTEIPIAYSKENGNNVTDFSNADRTYELEIYRPMGGAKILDAEQKEVLSAKAQRTVAVGDMLHVPRTYYTDFQQAKVSTGSEAAGDYKQIDSINTSCSAHNEGAHELDTVSGWEGTAWSGLESDFTIAGYNSKRQDQWRDSYYTKTASEIQFKLHMDITEGDDGYEFIRFVGTDNSAVTARFEVDPSGKNSDTNCCFPFPKDGVTGDQKLTKLFASSSSGKLSVSTGNEYFIYNGLKPAGGLSLQVSSGGDGNNDWSASNVTLWLRPGDYKEPEALSIAPMAKGDYLPGDQVTVSVVFNEIVDEKNSPKLGDVKLTTNWGEFTYAGGADTNVLYFTGTVPEGKEGSTLEVTGLTNLGNIKDMSPNGGTEATSITGATGAKVPATALTVTEIDKSAGGKLTATLSDVANLPAGGKVEYVWSDSALTPTVGWQTVTKGDKMETRQTEGTWYLYVRAVKGTAPNEVVVASVQKSIELGTKPKPDEGGGEGNQPSQPIVLPELTVSTDNMNWARSRTITLTKKGVAADYTVTVTKPDLKTETCTAAGYTADQNGLYTFEMTVDGESYTAMTTVSKVDPQNPTVSIGAVPKHTADKQYGQAVTLKVKADGTGSKLNLVGSWNKTEGGDPVTDSFTEGSGGTYTTTCPDETGHWTLTVTAKDEAGNTKTITDSNTYYINNSQPSITLTPLEDLKNPAGTVIGKQWSYTINPNGADITSVQLSGDGELTQTNAATGTVKLTIPGTYYIIVTDKVGHVVKSAGMEIPKPAPNQPALDGVAPKVSLGVDGAKEGGELLTTNWTNKDVTVKVTVTDDGLTAATDKTELEVTLDKTVNGETTSTNLTLKRVVETIVPPTGKTTLAAPTEPDAEVGPETRESVSYVGTFIAEANGTYVVKAKDLAENEGTGGIEIVNIDKTTPTIAYTIPSANAKGWHTADIEIQVTPEATGLSKLVSWAYKLPDGAWVTEDMTTKSFTLTANKIYPQNSIQIKTVNEAGTTKTITLAEELKLDKDKPTAPTVAYKVGNDNYTPGS